MLAARALCGHLSRALERAAGRLFRESESHRRCDVVAPPETYSLHVRLMTFLLPVAGLPSTLTANPLLRNLMQPLSCAHKAPSPAPFLLIAISAVAVMVLALAGSSGKGSGPDAAGAPGGKPPAGSGGFGGGPGELTELVDGGAAFRWHAADDRLPPG